MWSAGASGAAPLPRERDIRDAIWGLRPYLQADFLLHAEFLLNNVLWLAGGRDASHRDAAQARYHFAHMALHLSDADPEEDHV